MTSGRLIDLTGKTFGRLTVVSRSVSHVTPNGSKQTLWVCSCLCGKVTPVRSAALRNGSAKSCGCLQRELTSVRARTHGKTGDRTYLSWRGMRERCSNPNNRRFSDYGGKGVYVCERWADDFEAFLADMGPRPDGMTLDRIDNSGPYSPENCRWADVSTQTRNRSDNVWIDWNGTRRTLTDWAKELGLTQSALSMRIARWGLEEAMSRKRFSRSPR